MAEHHALLRQAFRQHGGCEVKEMGDAFLVAFARAGDALACAMAGQRALQQEIGKLSETSFRRNQETNPNSPVSQFPNFPLRVRMALHTGDVELQEGEYHGFVLHHIQRMLAAAHGGQILCSEVTAGLLQRHLGMDVWLADLSVYRLRDIETPQRLFQVCCADMAQREFPPLNAEAGYASNLPLTFTRFFGREEELAHLQEMLLSEETRLVTLTGPGGTGKTRLALEVARRLVEPFHGAVWFVPLADISDPRLMMDTVRDALRLPRSPNVEPLEQVVGALSRQPSVLVLDNMEHLLQTDGVMEYRSDGVMEQKTSNTPTLQHSNTPTSVIQTLLEHVPTLTCLVTSRQLLGLTGEREFLVPPLPTPNAGVDTPEWLMRCESVQLFVDRAQTVKPDFQVTNANASAIAELCDRLEGIPLAIELAAARAQVLTPAQMVAQLEHRFDFLVSRRRDAAERHRTLRAAMEWSYQLLSSEMQRFFMGLSVFRGGWTLEAAEAVSTDFGSGLSGLGGDAPHTNPLNPLPKSADSPDVLDCLAQLRECSLILSEERGAVMRFRMLETLREYGWDRLVESGEAEAVRGRHQEFFLQLAEQAESQLWGAEQGVWLERLETEHDNLRAVLGWSVESEATEAGLRLAAALWRFWFTRGYLSEGRAHLSRVLSHAKVLEATGAKAKALNAAGSLAQSQGDYASARSFYEESMAIRRELGDRKGVALLLGNLGAVACWQGDYVRACLLLEESLSILREFGDSPGIATALDNLGTVAHEQGDYAQARTFHEESLAIRRGLGDYAQAHALHEESLAIFRELGDKRSIAISLHNLGSGAYAQGDYAQARAFHAESVVIYQELNNNFLIAHGLEGLAQVACAQGQGERSTRLLAAAEALREAIGTPLSPSDRADHARNVAAARAALGEEAFAVTWAEGRAMTLEQAVAYALNEGER